MISARSVSFSLLSVSHGRGSSSSSESELNVSASGSATDDTSLDFSLAALVCVLDVAREA